MVSIRRRRLLAVCTEHNSGANHLPSNHDDFKPKEETTSGNGICSSYVSVYSSSKEQLQVSMVPEMKRRKQHRRKQVENQEPCIMRGVYFKNLKWQAAIKVDKKQIHLGTVASQEEAARLYDRAAFMCGREPNFELSEEEKQELRKFSWDQFLEVTRVAINSKKSQRRTGALAAKSLTERETKNMMVLPFEKTELEVNSLVDQLS